MRAAKELEKRIRRERYSMRGDRRVAKLTHGFYLAARRKVYALEKELRALEAAEQAKEGDD